MTWRTRCMDKAPILRVLLLGDPVDHSLSPIFQTAGFEAAAIAARYETKRVLAPELPAALAAIRDDASVLGANVTSPHKVTVAPLLDELHPEAAIIRAVNTISRGTHGLMGWNTDAAGFRRALKAADCDATRRRALVLGAGGAARAVVHVLREAGAKIWVAARDLEAARRVCRDLEVDAGGPAPLGSLSLLLPKVDLVVNATPVGRDGKSTLFPSQWLTASHFVFDLLYRPPVTPLVRAARERGARAVNGLTMLLYQGAASFEIWTGRRAPEAAMRAALERAAA